MSDIRKQLDEGKDRDVIEFWYEDSKKCRTPEALLDFVTKLLKDYDHDYGTICHAVTAAALAAARCVDADERHGGITGFQAGAIGLMFYRRWMSVEGPFRIQKFENALYPQYGDSWNEIDAETWKWLQDKARFLLDDGWQVHPDVVAHWESIAAGRVPFGLRVKS